MAKSNLSDSEQIDQHLATLEPSTKEIITNLREIILTINPLVAERIKWNSPSFYYTGEMETFDPKEYKRDLLVCNLHRGKILLVFPTGATIADTIKGKNYPDGRKIIAIDDLADLKAKETAIEQIIINWLNNIT